MRRSHALRWYPRVLMTAGVLAVPGLAEAAGGSSIASAPVFPFGTPVAGGGTPAKQYYRLPLFAGDRLTLDVSEPGAVFGTCASNVSFQFFAPDVTDYQVAGATPLTTIGTSQGLHEDTWTAPFTGQGILRELSCDGEPSIAAFTLTISVAHASLVSFRAGFDEASRLARELPGLDARDLQALRPFEVAARVSTGVGSGTVVMTGRTEPLPRATGQAARIRTHSAERYGGVARVDTVASSAPRPPRDDAIGRGRRGL